MVYDLTRFGMFVIVLLHVATVAAVAVVRTTNTRDFDAFLVTLLLLRLIGLAWYTGSADFVVLTAGL